MFDECISNSSFKIFFIFFEKQELFYIGNFSPALRFTLPKIRARARFDQVYLTSIVLL